MKINNLALQFVSILFVIFVSQFSFAESDSCECPKLSCKKECEQETDVTFYSEKCAGGSRVKSCARPTCVPLENAPSVCGFAKKEEPLPLVKKEVIASRDIATEEVPMVAEVTMVEGIAWVYTKTSKVKIEKGQKLRALDRIETGDNSRAQVQFFGQKANLTENILTVTPNSEVVIQESNLTQSDEDKRKVILDLIRGRIRNKVEKEKFKNNEQSYYRVKMPGAVAGVRGTDFVTSIEIDGEEVVSKVETLTGKVNLGDNSNSQNVEVKKGESSAYVSPKSILSKSDKNEIVAKGYLTPVYKMSDKELLELDTATSIAKADVSEVKGRVPSSEDKDICFEPTAKFNQCAWKCENNPIGEKKCRTDLAGVTCVRRICNANGLWSDPKRLPSSQYATCDGQKSNVGPCDY
jgi:hypothetical protein